MEVSKCGPKKGEFDCFDIEQEIEREMATYRFFYSDPAGPEQTEPELMLQYYPEIQ